MRLILISAVVIGVVCGRSASVVEKPPPVPNPELVNYEEAVQDEIDSLPPQDSEKAADLQDKVDQLDSDENYPEYQNEDVDQIRDDLDDCDNCDDVDDPDDDDENSD